MGLMSKWMNGTISNGASSEVKADKILHGSSNGFNPQSAIDWNVPTPTVVRNPITATTAEANKAEHEVGLLRVAVANGKRVLKAEGEKQILTADLASSHRGYLKKTANANLQIAQSNVGLATHLQNQRKNYAQLGMGLEQTVDKVNQTIDITAAKYGRAN